MLDLAARVSEAQRQITGTLRASGFEPRAQDFKRGWQDKDADRFADELTNACRTLHVNLKDDVVTFRQLLLDLSVRRAVMVSVNDSPFQKSARFDHLLELFDRNEEIVASILLTLARRASRKRNRIPKIRHGFQHTTDERSLTATRRRADDDEHPAPPRQLLKRLVLHFCFTRHSELARATFRPRP